jgi:hypothetical protein
VWPTTITGQSLSGSTGAMETHPSSIQVSTYIIKSLIKEGPATWMLIRIWIRIRIRVKSRIRIRILVEIQELWRLNMEPWRAVDTHNGGVEAQNALEDLFTSGRKL